jgi:hypothetical protein
MRNRQARNAEQIWSPQKGGSVNQNSGYTKLEFHPNALRIIAPFGRDNANYYALVNPQDGLCTGYHTPIEEVFFFKEFRDDTSTSFQNRVTWGRIVRNALDCQERIPWTRGYDKTKFHVDQKRSLTTELAALITVYRMGGTLNKKTPPFCTWDSENGISWV